MKFKVVKGTPLFNRLDKLRTAMNMANEAAGKIVDRLGFTKYIHDAGSLAGGIGAIEMAPETKLPNWTRICRATQTTNGYYPSKRKCNLSLLREIQSLPLVKKSLLTDILKYQAQTIELPNGSEIMSFHPGVIWRNRYILVSVPERARYKPVKGMVEITVSQFNKLKEAK